MYRIMIVEDDNKIADILSGYIHKYNYEVVRASRFHDIKNEFVEINPHLVLLDVNLPQYDGFYWCRQIRTVSNVPILFISARVGEMDQVMAIENGGDDYITKPFNLDVIVVKIKGILRRAYGEYAAVSGGTAERYEISGLQLDRTKNLIQWKGNKSSLSQNEFRLLDCLAQKVGQIVTREELLEELWDDAHFVDDNTLTVNVTRVRKKLEELGITDAIETVRGQGYRLEPVWERSHHDV
ncbi:response regulator transcription factor [Paenibacillus sp. J2TS4]|uniref:response regulator transcription factor n=1 Tax=Paenibacillus sp. J2TS4 TaxID=2807194 RepID=UPI001B20FAF7|nr:response regulator transcription factor [Paenibacillus sp. J2TS4]GIP35724.1 DNA-binding response regulator [Paenibacillus sp. J2TS4]